MLYRSEGYAENIPAASTWEMTPRGEFILLTNYEALSAEETFSVRNPKMEHIFVFPIAQFSDTFRCLYTRCRPILPISLGSRLLPAKVADWYDDGLGIECDAIRCGMSSCESL